jgi:hypothetical protein
MVIRPAEEVKQGKTHALLELATALANGGKIGVISSERGSSSLLSPSAVARATGSALSTMPRCALRVRFAGH